MERLEKLLLPIIGVVVVAGYLLVDTGEDSVVWISRVVAGALALLLGGSLLFRFAGRRQQARAEKELRSEISRLREELGREAERE